VRVATEEPHEIDAGVCFGTGTNAYSFGKKVRLTAEDGGRSGKTWKEIERTYDVLDGPGGATGSPYLAREIGARRCWTKQMNRIYFGRGRQSGMFGMGGESDWDFCRGSAAEA